MASEGHVGRQFLAPVGDLVPRTKTHPRNFIGDDEEYNGLLNDPHNPAPAYEHLKDDVRRRGMLEPLLVERRPRSKRLGVLDGHHRLQVAKELGLSHIPVTFERFAR